MVKIDWSQYREKPTTDWSQFKETEAEQNPSQTWSGFAQGLREGYPTALKSAANAASQLVGKRPFEQDELEPTKDWPRSLGRFLSETAGYGTAGAPLAAAGAYALPFAGAEIGSGLAGALFTKGGLRERLTDAALSSAIPGIGKLTKYGARLAKSYVTPLRQKTAASVIQDAHDKAMQEAVTPLNLAKQYAQARGKDIIPIKHSIIDRASSFLAKDRGTQELINEAKKGNYEAVFQLQSDLGEAERYLKNNASTFGERKLIKLIEETKNDILDSMHQHYNDIGHKDISALIKEGRSKYKDVMDTFYKKKPIANLVNEEREVPSNLINTISKDSAYYNKLRQQLPELEKISQHAKDKKMLKWLGKHVGYKTAFATAAKTLIPGMDDNE